MLSMVFCRVKKSPIMIFEFILLCFVGAKLLIIYDLTKFRYLKVCYNDTFVLSLEYEHIIEGLLMLNLSTSYH